MPWSVANQTALADAELEYKDVEDPSVYVEFPVDPSTEVGKSAGGPPLFFLVWTTTPWTLPANLAIAVGPEVRYAFVEYTKNGERRVGIVAEDLASAASSPTARASATTKARPETMTGRGPRHPAAEYLHPFIEYKGRHPHRRLRHHDRRHGPRPHAPGHGEDGYNTGVKHGLEVYSPVLANGRFDDTVLSLSAARRRKRATPSSPRN